MEHLEQVIIIDAGNTRVKFAVFKKGQLSDLMHFKISERNNFLSEVQKLDFPPIFISSVLDKKDFLLFFSDIPNVTVFSNKMKNLVDIKYKTPETLGLDRLANAAAIQSLQPKGPKVAIDMGTCIKFDFVDENGNYLGGSISPGLMMRYKALHHFTGKLPLLSPEPNVQYLGKDSSGSIQAGIIEGIQGELNHFISRYLQDYQGLTFFVTGGDAKLFEFPRKNNIFAIENLTLTGLYEIYLLNA